MIKSIRKLLVLWERYERHLSVGSMIIGFSFDLVIAKRPDSVYDNLLLLSYLLISATCIMLLNIRSPRESAEPRSQPLLLLLVLQFCFGGLSSNLLVLYGKSGTPAGSLIFLALLFGMLIGNEFLRTRYEQTRFNIAIYYILLLTYCVIAVPTFILHDVGPEQFLISGLASLIAMSFFLFILRGMTRLFRGKEGPRRLIESATIVGLTFLFFNTLYFFNIIPPVPLSLKAIGVYHYIVRESPDSYEAQYESTPWWEFWQSISSTYHATAGEGAYCFSSVFAPTGLTTPIKHQWAYYDPTTGQWEPRLELEFSISGGPSQGYHGFSEKFTITPGQWRCDVETQSGQLIGQVQFTVVEASTSPELKNASL